MIDNNILISIILFIIFYDIYNSYYKNIINKSSTENTTDTKETNTKETKTKDNKVITSLLNLFKQQEQLEPNNDELNTYLITQFGKPTYSEKDKFLAWDNPNEIWSKIIYTYNEVYPYIFFIKIKIPSLNDYENWKTIITNIGFEPKTSNLIIPTKDEETALSIANLIILNFKGELSLNDIVNKDLLGVSIYKSKKYELVKNKMKEEIINNLSNKTNKKTHSAEYQADLADNNFETSNYQTHNTQNLNDEIVNSNVDNQFIAWEGMEYSFI
jgi:hypothetical protein